LTFAAIPDRPHPAASNRGKLQYRNLPILQLG